MTEYVLNTGFEVDLSDTGGYGDCTFTRDTVAPIAGVASMRVDTHASAVREGASWLTATGLALPAGTGVSGGFYARGAGTVDVWIRIANTDASISELGLRTITLTSTTTFVNFPMVSVEAGKVGDQMELMCRTTDTLGAQAVTFYLDNGSIEPADGPTTPILDTFTRANENPLSGGGNWANLNTSYGTVIKLISNTARIDVASGAGSYWTRAVISDFECYCTIASMQGFVGLAARIAQPGGANTWDGYMLSSTQSNPGSPAPITLEKITNSVGTTIAKTPPVQFGDGLKILLRGVGPILQAWVFSSTEWVPILAVTDTTFKSGNIGLFLSLGFGFPTVTNFGGGQYSGTLDPAKRVPVSGRGATW